MIGVEGMSGTGRADNGLEADGVVDESTVDGN